MHIGPSMESTPRAPQVKVPDLPIPLLANTPAAESPFSALESTKLEKSIVATNEVLYNDSYGVHNEGAVKRSNIGRRMFTLKDHCDQALQNFTGSEGSSSPEKSHVYFQDLIQWMKEKNWSDENPYRVST